MKKFFFNVFGVILVALTAIMVVGCSHESNLVNEEESGSINGKGVQISFNLFNEGYGSDEIVGTRTSSETTGQVVASGVADLDDDFEALTEIVEEPKSMTRATVDAPSGDYTILAYQNGVKKAEWVGNYDGTTFKVNNRPAEAKTLTPGVYKFYVFSNHLRFENGKIKTSLAQSSVNALYLEKEITINNVARQELSFELKPFFARLNFKIKAFTNHAFDGPMTGGFKYNAGKVGAAVAIDPAVTGNGHVTTEMATSNGGVDFQQFTANMSSDVSSSYIQNNRSAVFYLPNTSMKNLNFQFTAGSTGTIYKKPVTNKVLSLGLPEKMLESGKSYTIVYTIYLKGNYVFGGGYGYYLYGTLLQHRGKKVLGIKVANNVVISLENLRTPFQWLNSNNFSCKREHQQNISELNTMVTTLEGYNESFVPSYTYHNGHNESPRSEYGEFTAFNEAEKFGNAKQIFAIIPAAGEWNSALKYLGITEPTAGFNSTSPQHNAWSGNLGNDFQEILFYQAGGTPLNGIYWGADSWLDKKALTVNINSNGANFDGDVYRNSHLVRPFLKL